MVATIVNNKSLSDAIHHKYFNGDFKSGRKEFSKLFEISF
jgi:hypothetical protein